MISDFRKFGRATNNEIFDAESCEWMVNFVETHETLDEFEESSYGWNDLSGMKTGEIAGFPFRAWRVVQIKKGAPRDAMSVIDFGDIRIALPGTNLAVF